MANIGKVAAYYRVSSSSQQTSSQKAEVGRWLKGNGITLTAEYSDTVSGATMERPGFTELQRAIWNGEIDHVVIYSLDRFARTFVDGILEIDKWQKKGVRITFVADMMDVELGSWQGDIVAKLMVSIKLALAEGERQKIRDRQRIGIDELKKTEAEALAMRCAGRTVADIATRLGVTRRRAERLSRPGGVSNTMKTGPRTDIERLRVLVASGLKKREIAAALGVSENTVYRLIRTHLYSTSGQKNSDGF